MLPVTSFEASVNSNPPLSQSRDPLPKSVFKRDAGDFQVVENLGFEPDGQGEHLWLRVRKTGCNTQELVDAIAKNLQVAPKDIGYSGLKDKRAITTQWLSVAYPIASGMPETGALFNELNVEVMQQTRSSKKLRKGIHRDNEFLIVLRDIKDGHVEIDNRLSLISRQGFPNYFGVQRFGIDGRNVDHARSMFTRKRKLTRFKRSLYLSAARSWLFNKVLDERIKTNTWQTVLAGDVCMLDGSNSIFNCEQPDAEIQLRHERHDLHVTGPLYGRGQSMATGAVYELESACLAAEQLLCDGLELAGLSNDRRALRATAVDLKWHWPDESTLALSFRLQRGAYATSLLSEIVELHQEHES